ncbi:MarR family winged helix-turn-helix transcriptional regulator [Trinickia caryophylli]|uniref:Transcriptional regulator, MarR family n=1 Tax=Trinickia caryophylli TaxID=28094 RepID=A0A1X7GRI9_TRICW|nr:MarR family winged helix-turn-helix transcriptional regulator [Trinickia caryophylli]PMS10572.1 MarR family transcriptional regulator [Trinickia caryophylli]TRX19033.1 MarR family transcriptional regulator [Trinickia caryophylli]WQE10168.1 MarR family winged helix-turn-helix transcriptional regulator [Trinickia caryophylli]SMF73653.1 transcriptional regulator, MarR family [Trinickia caryophylli]GLU35191.1 transcriptional regulator [Trinickia caryophylli]
MSEGVNGEQAQGRVTHSLLRLNTAMRSQAWEWAESTGLTPTQGEILMLLMQRKTPMRLGDIARDTALTAATTSDAVSTLEAKGLIEKRRALDDGRALAVRLTARGRAAAKRAQQWPDFLNVAIGKLEDEEQAVFYRTLIKMIRLLEVQGDIPIHRMCVTCKHFEPSKSGKKVVHRCLAYGQRIDDLDLRLDCERHEQADLGTQKKTWKIFSQHP